ncbi:unnamed protein product [Clonostachys rosea]|uniref:Rhamnogalacturonate lyase n=1 Tax=Bionectria ochroleuca TaxID=29856 RepID=A0ABY6UY55_BIOOC|nr:unnamed protein product [Clonostachys rosea]
MVQFKYIGALFLACAAPALAAFGVTESTSSYVADSGSSDGFVVTISRTDGSITSIKYRSTELQYKSKSSHIASGLGSATVSYKIVDNKYIVVSAAANNADFKLTHYYVFTSGTSAIQMATDTTSEPAIGELRFIARLNPSVLPDEFPFGDVSNTASGTAIEGSDVYLINGQTRSKFYSSQRFIDNGVYGFASSSGDMHASIVAHASRSYEKSSGGPFFRDINTNQAGDAGSLTFYMNSNHAQTEAYRQGFHGPYALVFSRSGIPKQSEIDFSPWANLGISGYIADSARGVVSGTASGTSSSFKTVVHWTNADYQYWAYAGSSGSFTSPKMVPGTYTQILYQGELKVASQSVKVTAGGTTTSNIAATSDIVTAKRTTVFQIGDWDGQPTGFLNAAEQLRMHPSDGRMAGWKADTFTVGSDDVSAFPMALFKAVNSPVTIKFNLDAAVSSEATLRIGTTLAFASGRPSAKVNSYSQSFSAPTKIDSRGVTRGAYRGLGEVYDVNIPAGTLKAGANTISIEVISGSSGDTFLSPNFVFDAVELFH